MSKSWNTLQVFEHQTLMVDDDSRFKMTHFNILEKYGYRTKEKYYSVGNKRIKFSNYVGVIQVKNLTIEILPKADNLEINQRSKDKWHDALISMLNECKLIKLDAITNARLKLKSCSVLDLFYDHFLTETEKIIKQGLRKNYRTIEENLSKLKGKILFTNHIKKNSLHQEQFYVQHEIFDKDNFLNQILFKALNILYSISDNSTHHVRIKRLLLHFEEISDENITATWFDRIYYNRNTERYRQAIKLAKLIILRYSPDLKGGNENILAITFDMNALYENYVYRKLKVLEFNNKIPIDGVFAQNRKPFWESRGVRADILVKTQSGSFIIDTKWKILKDTKPSDDDLKQMLVYNVYYDSSLSILLYPKTTIESDVKKPFKHPYLSDKYCQIAFIDLFNNDGKLEKELGMRVYSELL
ncbi:MAG: restriction endonuclease, partial [Bacteroidetes bacterium]|nr:restriction endonuclease [Bacteroidota bacterium]